MTVFIRLKTHTIHHRRSKIIEAGCQRGTNTCWLPLQLNDIIQVHKCTKSIKKKKRKKEKKEKHR